MYFSHIGQPEHGKSVWELFFQMQGAMQPAFSRIGTGV